MTITVQRGGGGGGLSSATPQPIGTAAAGVAVGGSHADHIHAGAHADLSGAGSNSHATIDTHIASATAHGTASSLVGLTDTQTLTNKTLTTPTIGNFINAEHTHQSNAGGGTLDASAIVTGTVAVARGGTGTGTQFTQGSVVFAGPSGIYAQDNANLFWDATNHWLGIGNTAPTVPLEFVDQGVTTAIVIQGTRYDTGGSFGIQGRHARGTVGSPTQVLSDDILFAIFGAGYQSGGAFSGARAAIHFRAAESYTATNQGAYIAFGTTPVGAIARVEVVRFGPAGNILLGVTAPGAAAAKTLVLTNGATPPTTSVDLVHVYGEDLSAGNAALAVYQESAVIVAAAVASTHKIPVRWNGVTYYLLASNV